VYQILKIVNTVAELTSTLRTYRYHTCSKGDCVFKSDWCLCGESRWKSCTRECYDEDDVSICKHLKTPTKSFWYMPIRDRLFSLLSSDLKNLFHYESYRHVSSKVITTFYYHFDIAFTITSYYYHFDIAFTITSYYYHFDIALTITSYYYHFDIALTITSFYYHFDIVLTFFYEQEENYLDDVYDSEVYVALKAKVKAHDPEGIPIYLQICWDGASMFNFIKGPSMWPLCYSIMNLPPALRNKMHIGLHVASFCDGAIASQEVMADEMLDLWKNPIRVNTKTYYVVISQILMDGPGRTKYTRCRSTNSKEGCNICDQPGRVFGKPPYHRIVYDGCRRHLPMNDPRRKKKSVKHKVPASRGRATVQLNYSFDEDRPPNKRRTYAEYEAAGAEAIHNKAMKMQPDATAEDKALKDHVEGVYGLWCLAALPYANLIHWTVDMMHSFANIIQDTLNSLRPTKSHVAGLYYQHNNRTYGDSVKNACVRDNTFPILQQLRPREAPPWVLEAKHCLQMDADMNNVMGAFASDEIPKHIFRAGKCQKSHDTIHWAHVFSQWCLRDAEGIYVENILEIFDIMTLLNGSRLHGPTLRTEIYPQLLKAIMTRSGLVPPSECCVTLHELIHICEQVQQIGNCRHSTLFKFEKVNKVMKAHVQNKSKGIVSFKQRFNIHSTSKCIKLHLHFIPSV